jgi:peptidoglycan/xylan/chitin deacetylase (PgdA/CDA1 family)
MYSGAISRLGRFKAISRELLASVLYRTGILGFLASRRLRRRAVVLMYHRVLPPAEIASSPSHPGIIVSTESFNEQMAWLSTKFRCLDLQSFTERLTGDQPFEDRSCLVTFDDGWKDNFAHAYPVLQSHAVPATIFLAAGFIGGRQRFWQERLAGLIRAACRHGALSGELEKLLGRCLKADDSDLHEEISRVISGLKQQPAEAVEKLTAQLSEMLEEGKAEEDGDAHFLSWEEVRAMAAGGIDFGAHGLSHTILTGPETDVGMELIESKRLVEQETGRQVTVFCYPNGDYDDTIARQVRESGYRAAFSTEPGFVAGGDDAYAVKRINIHEHMTRTIPLFLARIVGLW